VAQILPCSFRIKLDGKTSKIFSDPLETSFVLTLILDSMVVLKVLELLFLRLPRMHKQLLVRTADYPSHSEFNKPCWQICIMDMSGTAVSLKFARSVKARAPHGSGAYTDTLTS